MSKTKLMAILNVTPDSFYANSRHLHTEKAIERALQIEAEGADILDIGGESSRPGSTPITEAEEIARVIPVIQGLKGKLTIPISIDTTKPNVAKAAIDAGASLINDITGFTDFEMVKLAKETNLDICVMHMKGDPLTMQNDPFYQNGIVPTLIQWFKKRVETLIDQGINQEKIILDPGIGFGKTIADNLEIIHNLPIFKQLGFRLLLGASRKAFLRKILNKETEELLPATLATSTIAISKHVDIIRVHDVKEHRSVIDFMDAYNKVRTNL